jgi:hypothetical protein
MSEQVQEVVENVEPQTEEVSNEEVVEEQLDSESSEESSEEADSAEVQAETVEQLEEELKEAAEDGASKEELKQMVKEFELKVNGKTLKKKLDLNDHDAVLRELQRAHAGQIAMQDKAELEKALRTQVEEWKSNPWKFFEQMNMDPDELAEMRIQSKLEEMKKDPAQLAQEKMQEELEAARRELQEQKEREQQKEYERLQEEAAMKLDKDITEALDAHGSLPATPRVIRQIAETMRWAITPTEQGGGGFDVDSIGVKDVLPTVEAEIKKEISELMSTLPEQMMEQYIGQRGLDKLKQKRIKAASKAPKSAKTLKKPMAPIKEDKKEAISKTSIDDFLRGR